MPTATSADALAAAALHCLNARRRAHRRGAPGRLRHRQPLLHEGLVISGDRFVSTAAESDALRAALPDALAVEMEGAALAQVCADFGRPFAVLRTISDRADDSAHVDFTASSPRWRASTRARSSATGCRAASTERWRCVALAVARSARRAARAGRRGAVHRGMGLAAAHGLGRAARRSGRRWRAWRRTSARSSPRWALAAVPRAGGGAVPGQAARAVGHPRGPDGSWASPSSSRPSCSAPRWSGGCSSSPSRS